MNDEREVYLILKLKQRIRIDRNTSVSNIKQISRSIFGDFADDFLIYVNDKEITPMERMNMIRTLEYCQTDSIVLIPVTKEEDYSYFQTQSQGNLSVDLISSRREFQSQLSYSQYMEQFERNVKENELYRKNISKACVDLDELKKNIMAIKINNEDSGIVKANNLLKKANDIISNSDFLLNNFVPNYEDLEFKRLNSDPEGDNSFFNNMYKTKITLKETKSHRDKIPHADSSTKFSSRGKIDKSIGLSEKNESNFVSNNQHNQQTPFSSHRSTSHSRVHSIGSKTNFSSNNKEITLIKEENEYLKKKIFDLNKRISDLNEENFRLLNDQKESPEMISKMEEWNSKMEEIKTQLINSNKINNNLNENLEELERLNNILEHDNKSMVDRIVELERELIALNMKSKNNNDLYCSAINEVKMNYEKGLSSLNDELNEKEKMIEELKEKLYKIETQFPFNRYETLGNLGTINQSQKADNFYEKIKEDLRKQFEDIHHKFEDSNSINDNLVKLNDHLNQKLVELIEEIRKLNEKLFHKEKEVENLKRENSVLSQKVQETNSVNSERVNDEDLVGENFEDQEDKMNIYRNKMKTAKINMSKLAEENKIIKDSSKSKYMLGTMNSKDLNKVSNISQLQANVTNNRLVNSIESTKLKSGVSFLHSGEPLMPVSSHNFEIIGEKIIKKLDVNITESLELKGNSKNYPSRLLISGLGGKRSHSYSSHDITSQGHPKLVSMYYESQCVKRDGRTKTNQDKYIVNQSLIGNKNRSKSPDKVNYMNLKSASKKLVREINKELDKNNIQINDDPNKNNKNTGLQANYDVHNKPSICVTNLELINPEKEENKNLSPLKTIESYLGTINDSDASISMEINSKLMKNLDFKNVNNLTKYKHKSIKISEGAYSIFRLYDKKSVLRFDVENRRFKVIEFADFGNFEENYNPQGSIYLNSPIGLFIVTGLNHDMFYVFNYKEKTMNKLAKLNDNHTFGSLIYYEKENQLICLSGWHNKKVERYTNDELISGHINSSSNLRKFSKKNISKNVWTQMAEMRMERSECPYLIINEVELYAFFGFNCPRGVYVETVEKLDLEKPSQWQEIKFKNEKHLSTQIKSHSCVMVKESIVFLGGFDGFHDKPVESFFEFDLKETSLIPIERKYPDIVHNHFYNFQNDSAMTPYVDMKNRLHFAGFDENDRVHSIDVTLLDYDIFKFD